jgi:membrane protease YdiL (CAAX protease family)
MDTTPAMNTATHAPSPAWRPDIRTAMTWGLLAGLSAVAVLPYVRRLTPEAFAKIKLSLPMLAAQQGLEVFVLLGLLALFGLRMGHRVGLGSPLLQGWFASGGPGATPAPTAATLRPWHTIILGIASGLAIVGLSLALDPMLPKMLHPVATPSGMTSAIEGFLASFYGGITEELQLRLFLMTLLVWMLTLAGRHRPKPALFWLAIVVAAIAFGAGHLPAAQQVWGLSGIVVVRTIVLNALGGLVFGWLYWKRGFEMAMLGHFSADIVLHVLAPLVATTAA